MKRSYLVVSVFLLSFIAITPINAHAYALVEPLKSFDSVETAVAEISTTLEQKGYDISLVVDHTAGAKSVGLELRPTQVVFARPNSHLERRLLKRSNTLAIDLPIKVLAFEDETGNIQIRYNPIGYLVDRHNTRIKDRVFNRLNKVTEQLPDLEQGLVTIKSHLSYDNTVTTLQEAIASNPAFKIPLTLDFNTYRRRSQSTLIVFGNPNAGTPLMQATQEIAIDLPQKILVWKDAYQHVNISYNDPNFLAKRHNVQGQDQRIEAISNALASFAQRGAGN